MKYFLLLLCISLFTSKSLKKLSLEEGQLLTGTPISSDRFSNLLQNAFDGDINTEYKSTKESNSWIGLELDNSYKITKIGWSQKENNSTNYLLGIFEGANDPTFFDAVPLYMITEEINQNGQINYINIDISETFKYVRYIGPSGQYCIISNLEFYGYEISDSELENLEDKKYQPTNLPLIVVHTENGVAPKDKETDIPCTVEIIDNGKTNVKAKAVIKLRGNSTMRMDKTPYKIKFDEKQKLLDLPAKAKKWNLMANYADRTLLRTLLGFEISSLVEMKYTPQCRPVDVMVNGEFKGNYNLCDKIERNKNRVQLSELDENSNSEPEISGGYLLEATNYAYQDNFYINTTRGIILGIRYPKEGDISSAQFAYIENQLNLMESDGYSGIVNRIDFESFTKYLIVQELSGHSECFWSTYMTKQRNDDKFYFGPVWDFDLAFDNDDRVYTTLNKTNFLFKYDSSAGTLREFGEQLLRNEQLLQALKDRWNEITKTQVTKEKIINWIDEEVKLINDSQKLNFMKWKILDRKVLASPTARCSFRREVNYLKEYVQKRFDQVGQIINSATTISVTEEVDHFDRDIDTDSGRKRRLESFFGNIGNRPAGGHGGMNDRVRIVEECINYTESYE